MTVLAEPAVGDAAAEHRPAPLALYVHWPFCRSKCPYCDFNSHVREGIDEASWRDALLTELDHTAGETGRRRLTSIFFGGGTPSLMDPATVAAVIDRAVGHWPADPALEITLEANPSSAEAGRFAGYRTAGVGRLSLGVQALDDPALRFLGRGHDRAEALAALALARRLFQRLSFDLIYARPGQTVADWAAELDRAVDLAADHLSVYQLTLEPGTAFHAAARRGELALPDEATQAALYETTQAHLTAAGLPAYEISNHARPGGESRHNLTYWRYGDYAGIGPGAHGRLSGAAGKMETRSHRAPEVWLDRVRRHGHGRHADRVLDPDTRWREALLMGLRLAEGVPVARLEAEGGQPLDHLIAPERRRRLAAGGFLTEDGDRLIATDAGRQRLDAVLAALAG